MRMREITDFQIAIIGLGYVGLPLALAFSRQYPVVGFDIDQVRVDRLRNGIDDTNEVAKAKLMASNNLVLTSDPYQLAKCNCYFFTVPTPVDKWKRPDLTATNASELIGDFLKAGDVVIFESTVFMEPQRIFVVQFWRASGLEVTTTDDVDTDDVFYLKFRPKR